MKYFVYIISLLNLTAIAQQTAQFTQFTFNNYFYNPASAGSNINAGVEIIAGTRQQWIGFRNAPGTNFLCANYTIKPERSYKRWHNFGFLMNKERAGIFRNESYYLSYTIHLPINKKTSMAFGIFAGTRYLAIDRSLISKDDPVYNSTYPNYFFIYPDFIPGIRINNKTSFLDISVHQLYKNKRSQGDKQIGNKSALVPQVYVSFGKKFFYDNGIVLQPAVNIHSSFTNIPSIELNMMAYYRKRIGVGFSVRNKDFISGIIQIRFLRNVTAGFAYDYSINKFNTVAPRTLEFMIGVTPLIALLGNEREKYSVNRCPDFDF